MDYLLISLFGFGYLTLNPVHGAYTVSGANTLYSGLTFGYNANLRPSETVNVSVTLTLDSLNYVDFDKQTVSADGWITMAWQDSAFTWIPGSNSDIEYLFIKRANCWAPTVIIDNELSKKDVLNDDNLVMRVKHDNTITWEQAHVFTVYCYLDSSLFPFDKQKCYISIGTAAYDTTAVLLTHGGSDVITKNLETNSDWSIEETSLTTKDRVDSSGLYYTNLIFNVELKRNRTWYVINILVPWIVTSFLGLVVFCIPVGSGEKIAYTSTILVVNAILLGISSYFLPTSSVSAPVLGAYMLSNLILNVVEILLTVVSIRIHNRHSKGKAVPLTTKALVRKFSFNSGDGNQTHEIIDLTSDDKKRSHTLKSKFSMKSHNKVSPSPMPTPTGYQRMESGTDSNPSVDPELDGRTNVPSNSRYRPSSYTHIRPTSQLHERPASASYTPHTRPMSWKSTAGIQIRENSFVNEDISLGYPADTEIINTVSTEQEHVIREPANIDVTSDAVTGTGNELQKRPSENSTRQAPPKAISFRSTRGKDESEVTWPDVAGVFDFLCLVVMCILVILLTVVIYAIFLFK